MMIPEATKRVLVFDEKGRPHVADISDIVNRGIDSASIRPALEAYFKKYNMRIASPEEQVSHGFPQRKPQLDRWAAKPKRQFPY